MAGQIARAILWSPGVPQQNPDFPSKQLLEDPFSGLAGYGETLRLPPYSLEQLALLPQHSTIHEAALRQKTFDIIGPGPNFMDVKKNQRKGKGRAPRTANDEINNWWSSLGEEYSISEIMHEAWHDYETTGWGFVEVGRNNNGKVGKLYYVPAHTIRAHMDGHRFAQMRNGRFIWFKRWGDPIADKIDYYAEGGAQSDTKLSNDEKASELLVFRSPTPESSWYGVPYYLSAIGWVTLVSAARDWNILFFENMREPRHLIVISGLPDDITKVADDLEEIMKTALEEPHRNVIIPVAGQATVTIQKMSVENDGQFSKLIEQANAQILSAHRVPADRLGIVRANNMIGGSTSQLVNVANAIYKMGVVKRGQDIFTSRVQNFVEVEHMGRKLNAPVLGTIDVDLPDPDIIDKSADANVAALLAKDCLVTLNEARGMIGEEPLAQFKDMTYMEYLVSVGVAPTAAAGGGMGLPGGPNTNTNNPGLQPKAALAHGEPNQGRPPSKTQPNNAGDHVNKSIDDEETLAWAQYLEARLGDVEDTVDELLHMQQR